MRDISFTHTIASVLFALSLWCLPGAAAELQARTIDGQTIQGEYIGTENNIVKLRSKYGVVNIPSKDIVTLTAVAAPAKAKGDDGSNNDTASTDFSPEVFKEPKTPNLMSLVAARLSEAAIGEPSIRERQEIYRGIRNFAESTDRSRDKIIRSMQDLGAVTYPYIAASYVHPFDIFEKVELLRALAVPDSPYTAGVFAEAHNTAENVMNQIANSPPTIPPKYPSRREQELPEGKPEQMRAAAANLLTLEDYASTAGGPLNALFLLDVYKRRYEKDKSDALLNNIVRDSARLANTATDATKSSSSWLPSDRLMLSEQLLPLLFKDNEDYRKLAKDTLVRILPSGHPKWEAPQSAWVEWWQKKMK